MHYGTMSDEPLIAPPVKRVPTPGLRESVEASAERAAAEQRLKERGWQGLARTEAGLIFGVTTMLIFQLFGTPWVANLENTTKAVGLFVWLFMAILTLSFGVVRHADCLAVLLVSTTRNLSPLVSSRPFFLTDCV